jgi:hypothetical protein
MQSISRAIDVLEEICKKQLWFNQDALQEVAWRD